MQFEGGYRYPANVIQLSLSFLCLSLTVFLAFLRDLTFIRALTLFLNLQGTALLASAFTPGGLTPPPDGLVKRVVWFWRQQGATPVVWNQPMFYGGLLLLGITAILGAA